MELPKTRHCGYVDHRSRIYRLLRNGEGHKMATTITRGSNPTACTGCNACRQRGSHQINQDTNVPPPESTHRTQASFHPGNGRPKPNHDERDSREGESSGPPNKTSSNEPINRMDEEDLFQDLFNQWIN